MLAMRASPAVVSWPRSTSSLSQRGAASVDIVFGIAAVTVTIHVRHELKG